MVTLSADVTSQMVSWADEKVSQGDYKSRSEIVRELFRERMVREKHPQAMASKQVLLKAWENEDDSLWESYL